MRAVYIENVFQGKNDLTTHLLRTFWLHHPIYSIEIRRVLISGVTREVN